MEKEVWKSIPNYEGLYEVSSLGKIKSLPREVCNSNRCYISKERILKPGVSSCGYLKINLFKNKKPKTRQIHQLVAEAFLNHNPCGYKLVIDHINDNPLDNRLENLQIVTHRFNICKTQGKYSSNFKGVSWSNRYKKWKTSIMINGKSKYLGYFNCEKEASEKYQTALKTIEI